MAKTDGKVTVAVCWMAVVPSVGSKVVLDGKGVWTVTGTPVFNVNESLGAATLTIALDADNDEAQGMVGVGLAALRTQTEKPDAEPSEAGQPAEKDKV
jgi:hypothetical protein